MSPKIFAKLGVWTLFAALAAPVTAAGPSIVSSSGRWAALKGPAHCEAASLALLPASRTRAQARASLSFDARSRLGEAAFLLSRAARPGSSVLLTIGETPFLLVARGSMAWSRGAAQEAAIIAAMRDAGGMRVEARSPGGGRFIDRYDLTGAPTAIDAAAACAATILGRR